ncbi:hypothetical protein [Acidianus brierleyi]|uniref:Transmembrane protein n=1 Tax=Acidianus brierleyi TaxID=41673 RepID=A0A2U9ICT5_9CREN|nr:hypothetical protein [Acidianus brierleyi]AWR93823.1 hypothetical protein DFR85_03535 [Acidianus brierleyi]
MKNENKGAYSLIKFLRFSLAFAALLNIAAHLYAVPAATPIATMYLDSEVALYIFVAMIYTFGLRMWYWPALLYSVLNISLFFISGITAVPGVTPQPLVGHIEFLQYSFGRAGSVIAWLYLIIVGYIAIKYDKGSKINDLLKES